MKTAVEWLEDNLIFNPWAEEHFKHNEKCWEQAKEMEKQQIIEAHGNKQKTKSNPDSIVTFGYTYTGEMYYDETFKNE